MMVEDLNLFLCEQSIGEYPPSLFCIRDACFLDLGTLFLVLYMFFGPGQLFFTRGHKKCGGLACVYSGPCGDLFFDLRVFVLDPGNFI